VIWSNILDLRDIKLMIHNWDFW